MEGSAHGKKLKVDSSGCKDKIRKSEHRALNLKLEGTITGISVASY